MKIISNQIEPIELTVFDSAFPATMECPVPTVVKPPSVRLCYPASRLTYVDDGVHADPKVNKNL